MEASPKKHHYIPECYLNAFADSKKKFWKKRNDNGIISESNPAKVCYEIDANRIRNKSSLIFSNLQDEYFIEKMAFRRQENNYPTVLSKLIKYSDFPLIVDKNKYHLFLETLITIKRRNPTSRKRLIGGFIDSRTSSEAIEAFKKELGREFKITHFTPEMDNQIKYFFENEAQNPDTLHDMYLSAYVNKTEYTTIAEITNQLYSLKQYVLHSPLNNQFVTSDNPGFTKCGNDIISLGGFGGDFMFYFPISPNTCLFINTNNVEQQGIIEKPIYPVFVKSEIVSEINQYTKSIANSKLFAYSKSILGNI